MDNSSTQATVLSTCAVFVPLVPILIIGKGMIDTRKTCVSKVSNLRSCVNQWSKDVTHPTNSVMTAKKSHGGVIIGTSMFAGYMGSWVLTGPVEVGYNNGWLGVSLYALACVLPLILFAVFAPMIRNATKLRGFTIVDVVRANLGRFVEFVAAFVALLLLWLSCISDFLSMNGLISVLSPATSTGWISFDMVFVGVCTTVYSSLGGFNASLFTDVVQVVALLCMVGVVIGSIWSLGDAASTDSWDTAGTGSNGICVGLVLNMSVILVTFADSTFWQKFYATKDDREYWIAIGVCSLLYIPVIALFGGSGVLARALVEEGVMVAPDWAGNSLFALVSLLESPGLSGTVVCMGVLTVLSSVDSRVLSIATLFSKRLVQKNYNLNWSKLISSIALVLAIVVAVLQPASVISILYCSNLVGCISAPTLVLCGWTKFSKWAALMSMGGSLLASLIFGWCYMGTFAGGFQWFVFPLGYYEWSCFYTFVGAIAAGFGFALLGVYFFPADREVAEWDIEETSEKDISLMSSEEYSVASCDELNQSSVTA